jgi:hypothetical protein
VSASVLSPVTAGVATALTNASLTNLASGPFDTEVPQNTAFPYVWFVVREENARGLGTGGLRKLSVRVHAASIGSATKGPAKELQDITGAAVALLEDATLTVSGFRAAGPVFYSDTSEPLPSEIGGQACWESIANFYLWVEP